MVNGAVSCRPNIKVMERTIVLTDKEFDTIMAGLFKLKKAVKDRIKSNSRLRCLDDSPKIGGGAKNVVNVALARIKHKEHQENRLVEIEQLIEKIK